MGTPSLYLKGEEWKVAFIINTLEETNTGEDMTLLPCGHICSGHSVDLWLKH